MTDVDRTDANEVVDKMLRTGKSAKEIIHSDSKEEDVNESTEMEELEINEEVTKDPLESEVVESLKPLIVPPDNDFPEGHSESTQRLGYLRPKDEFTFEKEVPCEGIELLKEYRIVPADRGFIRFTDDFQSVIEVPLDYAIGIKVRLVGGEIQNRKYPFYPGDRVKSKETGALGEVILPRAQGYEVRFDGYDETTWVPMGSIRLIDKDLTTRNYVRVSKDNFIVSFGDTYETFTNTPDAMDFLRTNNRPAFNRLSKLILAEGIKDFSWIDRDALDYFLANDKKLWDRRKVSELKESLVEDL